MANELVASSIRDVNADFYALFSENVYHSRRQDLVDGDWKTSDRYLRATELSDAYEGKASIGFFSRIQTRMLCLDVDYHGRGVDMDKNFSLDARKLATLFGVAPSKLERTRRGFHLFYFLSDWANSTLLSEVVRSALKSASIRAEIKGTSTSPLSVPKRNRLVGGASVAYVYPSSIFLSLCRETKGAKRVRSFRHVGTGETNEALCAMIPYMKFSLGLSDEEAAEAFSASLDEAYSGELRNARRLIRRVSSFKEPVSSRITLRRKTVSVPGVDAAMKELGKSLEFRGKKLETLRKFVECCLSAKESFESVCSTKLGVYYMNARFPYSKKYADIGATPIPSILFQKVNTHYPEYVRSLVSAGFLSLPEGRHYDVARHSCIHYVVGFVEEKIDEIRALADLALSPQKSNYVLNCLSVEGDLTVDIEGWEGYVPEVNINTCGRPLDS